MLEEIFFVAVNERSIDGNYTPTVKGREFILFNTAIALQLGELDELAEETNRLFYLSLLCFQGAEVEELIQEV